MIFTNLFITDTASSIAEDADYFAAGADLSIALVENDFTPDPSLEIADVALLSSNGITPKALGAGAAHKIWDDVWGVWGFAINEPAGGLLFQLTSIPDPVITAYGWALYNSDTQALIATARFDEPIVLTTIGQYVEISAIVGWLQAPFIGDKPTLS